MIKALPRVCKPLFALFLFIAAYANGQPKIDQFSPSSGPVGAAVTITGSGFDAAPANNIVYFGAVKAPVTAASSTSLTVTVPAGATYKPLSVLNVAAGLTAYAAKPFTTTFANPFGAGIPPGFYRPRVNVAVNFDPKEFAIGDIDGDGKPDLVVATASSMAVLRNVSANGSIAASSFATEVNFLTGAYPTAVAIGDLDGDGRPDVVVANGNAGSVSVFRNISVPGAITAASFAAKVDFATGGISTFVAIGDLDGDGRADLAVVNSVGTTISVLRNTGIPGYINPSSFAVHTDINVGRSYNSIVIADLDGDRKPDITAAGEFLSVLRNVSAPGSITPASFAAGVDFAIGSGAQFVIAGDVDGDGKPDLISTGDFYDSVNVLRNTSVPGSITPASFAAGVDFAVGQQPTFIALADLNGDGRPDLVSANSNDNTLSVLSNAATPGSITSASFAANSDFLAGAAPGAVSIGDLDGDGIPEIAVLNSNDKNISLFKISAPANTLVPVISDFTPASGVAGATVTISGFNFNAAAASNIVYFGAVKAAVTAGSATSLTVKVPAGATYQPISVLNTSTGLTAYASGSFNPVFPHPYDSILPAGFYRSKVDIAAGQLPYALAFGDLDGDGKPDMVTVNANANTVSVMRNMSATGVVSAASFGAKIDFATGIDPRSVAVGDVNGDGKPDIVFTNAGSGTVSVLRNTAVAGSLSATSFADRVDFATGSSPFSVAIGDVNNDGKPDLVVANLRSGTVSVLRNTTTSGNITAPSFAARLDYRASSNTDPQPRFVATGDLDGDGKPEIIVANEHNGSAGGFGSAFILHNNTTAGDITASSFATGIEYATGVGSNCVAIGDLDLDGRPDLAVSSFGSNTITLLKNNFVPGIFDLSSFSYGADYATNPQPFFVAIADADGDGKPDLVSANAGSNTVTVLRNTFTNGTASSDGIGFSEEDFSEKHDFTTGGYPVYAAVGDLDGDGIAELATANGGANTISILKILPAGAPVITSFNPENGPAGATVTITGSGFNASAANNTVYFGAVKAAVASGSATRLTVTAPAGATYAPLSVLNNANGLTGYALQPFNLTFFNPSGSGIPADFYGPKVDFSTGNSLVFGVVFGDVDGDGKPDMITVNAQANTISVLRNTSATGSITAASFAGKTDFAAGINPRVIAVGDIDGDGKLDIVAGNPSSNSFSVWRNTAAPGSITPLSFAARVDFSTGAYLSSLALGDLDSDGKPDLVVTNLYAGTISVLRNISTPGNINAASFAAKTDYVSGDFPRAVVISDVDGDGRPEIVVANEHSNNVSVFWNLSAFGAITAASFSTRFDFPAGVNPPGIAAGDVDGDGKPDIVVANYGSSTVSVLRNTSITGNISAASFAEKADYATGLNPYFLIMGDADGDGKPDLVTANANANTVSVLRNVSTAGSITAASFAAKADFGVSSYPVGLAMGDLDGDGVAELAAANAGSGTISVLQISVPALVSKALPGAPVTDQTSIMQLYPNPTKGRFTLQLQGMKAPVANVEVFNQSGTAVEKRVVNPSGKAAFTLSLDLRSQPAGVYYVKVTGVDGVQVVKVVVQR